MLHKGDDTNAFGRDFLTINLINAEEYTVSKAEVIIGSIIKTFENPVFPLRITLSREETMKLEEGGNRCRMILYDENNLRCTANGGICFNVAPKVV